MRLILCLLMIGMAFGDEGIVGFWKSLKDDGSPQCVFGIYEFEGFHYGKIIGTYNEEGIMADTIYAPKGRAAGVIDNPFTCGLDIILYLQNGGKSFDGTIVDPSKGKTYKCSLWRQAENLIVRGKLFVFGKNLTWYPTSSSDFPKNFKLPDLKTMKPTIPQLY